MHRFTDNVFAQHRTDSSLAISAARKGRSTRAFKCDIPAASVQVDHLAKQDSPPIPKLRHKTTELMAGIRLRQRFRSCGNFAAGEYPGAIRRVQGLCFKTQLASERVVKLQHSRGGYCRRFRLNIESVEIPGVSIVKAKQRRRGWCAHRVDRYLIAFKRKGLSCNRIPCDSFRLSVYCGMLIGRIEHERIFIGDRLNAIAFELLDRGVAVEQFKCNHHSAITNENPFMFNR